MSKKNKKTVSAVAVVVVCAIVAFFAMKGDEANKAAAQAALENAERGTGVYAVFNQTGETVNELFIHMTSEDDKGGNYAASGMAAGDKIDISYDGLMGVDYTIEFVTESGYKAAFTTLHIEEAPISLLSTDAMTGPTPIAFAAP